MKTSESRFRLSTSFALGSALALGLSAAACSSSSDTPAGGAGGADAGGGGATSSTGGAKSTGGSSSTGGAKSTGGSSSAGGSSSTGGKGGAGGATAGDSGTGGANTGGTDGGDAGCVAETLTRPSNVATKIQVPDAAVLVHHFHAAGTQDYKCATVAGVGDAGPTYTWAFTGPEAVLSDNCGRDVGTHYAGPLGPTGPRWQITVDGSIVQGSKKDSSAVVGAIPELLLAGTEIAAGAFSNVTYIQRLGTTGGVAPATSTCTGANLEEVQKVPYTADYYFYTGPVDGGTP